MAIVFEVYGLTRAFPQDERYGLASQMRRAAVSIPSNVAEGVARRTTREYLHFLYIARGSLAELQTQLLLAGGLGYISDEATSTSLANLDEVGRLLTSVITSLGKRLQSQPQEPFLAP